MCLLVYICDFLDDVCLCLDSLSKYVFVCSFTGDVCLCLDSFTGYIHCNHDQIAALLVKPHREPQNWSRTTNDKQGKNDYATLTKYGVRYMGHSTELV